MRCGIGKFAGTAFVAAGLLAAGAMASPTCLTTNTLPGGSGIVLRSMITTGYCVIAKDTLYGNFTLGNLPTETVLIFNNNPVGGNTQYQLSFDAVYKTKTTYNWGYEVTAAPAAPSGTVITSLSSDFTQTAGGLSTLDKGTNPTTATPIHMVKKGPDLQAGSISSTDFGAGVPDLVITESLIDKGTISSVTNSIVEFSPPHNQAPEPATLALLGAGIAGAGFLRRKRRA